MITRGSNLSSWKFLEADFRSANTAYSGPDVDTGKVRAPDSAWKLKSSQVLGCHKSNNNDDSDDNNDDCISIIKYIYIYINELVYEYE